MPTPFETLQEQYPWPEAMPAIGPRMHGWFFEANQCAIGRFLPSAKFAIELGSWFGMSAKWMVEQNRGLKLVCVDHWASDSSEDPSIGETELFAEAGDRFLCNMWPFRDRVIPLKRKSNFGIIDCYAHGIEPDFIYVDAGHDYESALTDLALCAKMFPKAGLCGDDWVSHPGVKQAVEEVCAVNGWAPVQIGNAWAVDK